MTQACLAKSKQDFSDILITRNHLKICEINTIAKFAESVSVLFKVEENVKKSQIHNLHILFYPKKRYCVASETVEFLYSNLTSIEFIRRKKSVYIHLEKKHGKKVR